MGLQAMLWPLPAPTVSRAQKHSGLCRPGLVHQPRLSLRSRGALWWLMGPTSEAARDPRAGPGLGLPPSPEFRGGEDPGGGPGVSGEGAHRSVTCFRVLLQTPRSRAARIPIFQRSQGLELERQKGLQGVNQGPVLLLGRGTVSARSLLADGSLPTPPGQQSWGPTPLRLVGPRKGGDSLCLLQGQLGCTPWDQPLPPAGEMGKAKEEAETREGRRCHPHGRLVLPKGSLGPPETDGWPLCPMACPERACGPGQAEVRWCPALLTALAARVPGVVGGEGRAGCGPLHPPLGRQSHYGPQGEGRQVGARPPAPGGGEEGAPCPLVTSCPVPRFLPWTLE